MPKVVPLRYGDNRWCELCKRRLQAGDRVAWWRVRGYGGRKRWAVYCAECHWSNVRVGEGLR
jgi:hypothetical protein